MNATGSARDGVCKDLYRVNDSSARSQLFIVYIKVGFQFRREGTCLIVIKVDSVG